MLSQGIPSRQRSLGARWSLKTVAKTAVIDNPDVVKGNIIRVFVIRRAGYSANDELKIEHLHDVKITPGLITIPSEIKIVLSPPKTRSSKIMQRTFKVKERGMAPGDISTPEE